jgi:hypothetical protein
MNRTTSSNTLLFNNPRQVSRLVGKLPPLQVFDPIVLEGRHESKVFGMPKLSFISHKGKVLFRIDWKPSPKLNEFEGLDLNSLKELFNLKQVLVKETKSEYFVLLFIGTCVKH